MRKINHTTMDVLNLTISSDSNAIVVQWCHEHIFLGQLPQIILGGWVILLDRNNIFVFNYHYNI